MSSRFSIILCVYIYQQWSHWRIYSISCMHSFKTRPGPAGRPDRPGAGAGPGWKKIGKGKTWRDPAKTGQKLDYDLLIFFFTKIISFWFFLKKKWTRATRWPGQNPGSKPWTGLVTRSSMKTMIACEFKYLEINLNLFWCNY